MRPQVVELSDRKLKCKIIREPLLVSFEASLKRFVDTPYSLAKSVSRMTRWLLMTRISGSKESGARSAFRDGISQVPLSLDRFMELTSQHIVSHGTPVPSRPSGQELPRATDSTNHATGAAELLPVTAPGYFVFIEAPYEFLRIKDCPLDVLLWE